MVVKRLIEKVNSRLRSNKGESISETMVALLISALALAMLAGVIAASARMITKQKGILDKYYTKNEAIVKMDASGTEGTVILDFPEEPDDPTVSVNYYTNNAFKKNPVKSYKAQ